MKRLEQLAKLRQEIDYNAQELKSIIYNPEFVKEILEAAKEVREGKGTRMTMEELKELCK